MWLNIHNQQVLKCLKRKSEREKEYGSIVMILVILWTFAMLLHDLSVVIIVVFHLYMV
jgi:hypothetical protein